MFSKIDIFQDLSDPLIEARIKSRESYTSKKFYIDKTELDFLQRWQDKPKEMTRRLLKHLVGEKNLKNMCALGKDKTIDGQQRKAVPGDILKCVESKF